MAWPLTGTSGKLIWFFLPTRWPTPTHRPCRGGEGGTDGSGRRAEGGYTNQPTNQESPVGQCVPVDCPHCAKCSGRTTDHSQCNKEQVGWEEGHRQHLQPLSVDNQRHCTGTQRAGVGESMARTHTQRHRRLTLPEYTSEWLTANRTVQHQTHTSPNTLPAPQPAGGRGPKRNEHGGAGLVP